MVKPWYQRSRFWVSVVSAVCLVATQGLGISLPTDAIQTATAIIIAYVLGESVADAVGRIKSS
jgi:uncharacterized membrane protein